MKVRFVFVVLAVVATTSAAQTPHSRPGNSLEQTLIAAEKSFIGAAKGHDDGYFKRTLADDYSFVGYDGQLHDREEVLAERSFDSMELTPYNMKVMSLDETTAVVTYDAIVHVPPEEDQGPPPRYQHWSSIWTKQGDQWKLKFQQSTPSHWGDW